MIGLHQSRPAISNGLSWGAAKLVCAAMLCMAFAAQPVFAHQAPRHEHAKLVPIPDYVPDYVSDDLGAPETVQASAGVIYAQLQDMLAGFGPDLLAKLSFAIDAPQRRNWSNFPAEMVPRDGVPLAEMSDVQRAAVFKFLSASLGQSGYEHVADIMAAEAELSANANVSWSNYYPENYFFAVFGTPSERGPWGWQFGGHHLGINASFDRGHLISLSPTHLGSEPVLFTYGGQDYSVLTDLHAAGLNLYNALGRTSKAAAKFVRAPYDVVTGPGNDGFVPKYEGVVGRDLDSGEKAALLAAIKVWTDMEPAPAAKARLDVIASELDETYFAWAWDDNPVSAGYYRIHGPSLIIEHASFGPARRISSEKDGHYHLMYRNPRKDYGGVMDITD